MKFSLRRWKRLIEMLCWILLGCMLGAFSGLVPGIHINTISALILIFAAGSDFNLALLVVAMSITHCFFDFIPSIALGAPDGEGFLSALPGHRLLLAGKGHYAIKLSILGGLFGGIASIAILPVFILFTAKTISVIYGLVPVILILVLMLMVAEEQGMEKRLWAIAVIALSALAGIIVLQKGTNFNGLFPLITGLFGASTLLYSMRNGSNPKSQEIANYNYGWGRMLGGSLMGTAAGSIVSLLPSIGPSEAAFILKKIAGKLSPEKYLVVLGGISTSNMIFSFFVLFLLGKTRTGSAAAVKQLVELEGAHLFFIVAAALIAIGISAIGAEIAASVIIRKVRRLNYTKLNAAVFGFLVVLTLLLSGISGLLIFATAAAIGIIPIASKIRRTHCMAFLMLPTIIFYLGI